MYQAPWSSTLKWAGHVFPLNDAAGSRVVEPIALQDVRILLVEVDVEHRDAVALMLRGYWADVYATASAGEALGVWRSFQPHAIVSDVFLTASTSFWMLRRLRREGCAVPAIAVTAWADADTRAAAADAGFSVFLKKPVAPRVLLTTIQGLLGRASEPTP
jgi:DNA-binding response OmpR family regulator